MKTKICSKCKNAKSITEFWKQKSSKDGLHCWCKECYRNWRREWNKNNPEKCRKNELKWQNKNPERRWASSCLGNHRRAGYKINITIDELHKMAKNIKSCPICNKKLDYRIGKGKTKIDSPALDRINNEKTLNRNNVWIICYKCNTIKQDLTLQELAEWCKKFLKYYNHVCSKLYYEEGKK